jgi:PAS domain S-box-containing protein
MPFRPDPFLARFEPLRLLRGKPWIGYGAAVLGVALATALRLAIPSNPAPFVTYYPFIILVTLVGGWRAGALSTIFSAAAADYFIMAPRYSFELAPGDQLTLAIYVFVCACLVALVSLLNTAVDRLWRQATNVELILEKEPTGLFAVLEDGTIEMSNAAAEKLFGYSKAELLGRQIDTLVPEDRRAAHAALRRGYLERPEDRMMGAGLDLAGLRKDGTAVPVEVGLSPFDHDGHKGALATIADISERKAIERRQQILASEIRHRGRNLLAVVQAMLRQVITLDRPVAESRQEFSDTIDALARAHDLFLEAGGVSLAELAEMELAAFDGRVSIDLPSIPLTASAGQDFALIFHELATNALKHGALSVPGGHVSLTGREDGHDLIVVWQEIGGPPVVTPNRRGFGQTILVNVAQGFCREVESDYRLDGFHYRLRADLARIATVVELAAWRAGST